MDCASPYSSYIYQMAKLLERNSLGVLGCTIGPKLYYSNVYLSSTINPYRFMVIINCIFFQIICEPRTSLSLLYHQSISLYKPETKKQILLNRGINIKRQINSLKKKWMTIKNINIFFHSGSQTDLRS